MKQRHLLSLVVLALASATVIADDWPQWRGANRDNISTETGLLKSWPTDGPPLAWKVDLKGVGYGGPAISKGKLFILAASDDKDGLGEYALALDTKNGEQIWKTEFPKNDGKYSTGWGSGPRSTPTVDGDTVYVLSPRGELMALKTSDGKKIWSVNLKEDFAGKWPGWGYAESVLIDGEKLVCTPGGKDGTVLALNKKTGEKIWQSSDLTDAAGYASLIPIEVGGVRQYVTQTQESACGVRASDGKRLWRVADLKRRTAVIPTAVVADGYAFFSAGYGAGCELFKLEPDGNGGTTATTVYTRNPTLENQHGGMVRLGEHIYGYSDKNGWLCLDFKKGGDETVWTSKKLDKGSVTFADGHLYCFTMKTGTVALVEATTEGWNETGRFEIPSKSTRPRRSGQLWTHPVVANGKLYIRDHELLFCFDIAAK